jgi:hypothetical protein
MVGGETATDGLVLREHIEKRPGPAIRVPVGTESVVDDTTSAVTPVAADVVAQEEVGEKQVSATGEDGSGIGECHGRGEKRRLTTDREQRTHAAFGEEPLMDEVRSGPDPQVPRVRS